MMRSERTSSDYDELMHPARKARQEKSGKQPGDPAKAARVLLKIIEHQNPPTHRGLKPMKLKKTILNPSLEDHVSSMLCLRAGPVQDYLLKLILSSITAFGPIGTRPGLGKSSLRKTILSRQTLRRKSSNTWIVNCSPGQRR
jgi:hypothetical protein